MASGYYTKQADQLSARYLNNVNDAAQGGAIVSLPAGVTGPVVSATTPGDRICLDDATALALSDTVGTGTLWGGIYEYVQTFLTSAAAPAIGTAAFFRAADVGGATPYLVTADAQPTILVPTFFQGVFINAITKGNYGWIQVAGIANCLYDSAVTLATLGTVTGVKVNAAVPSTFDSSPVNSVITQAAAVGVSLVLPVISTLSKVVITRGIGRI